MVLLGDHGTPDSFFGVSDSSPGACDQKRPYLGVLMPSGSASGPAPGADKIKKSEPDEDFSGLYERLTASPTARAQFERKAASELTSSWDLFATLRHLADMPVEGGLFSADSLARNDVDFFGRDLPKSLLAKEDGYASKSRINRNAKLIMCVLDVDFTSQNAIFIYVFGRRRSRDRS